MFRFHMASVKAQRFHLTTSDILTPCHHVNQDNMLFVFDYAISADVVTLEPQRHCDEPVKVKTRTSISGLHCECKRTQAERRCFQCIDTGTSGMFSLNLVCQFGFGTAMHLLTVWLNRPGETVPMDCLAFVSNINIVQTTNLGAWGCLRFCLCVN